jgi:magnesium transporter
MVFFAEAYLSALLRYGVHGREGRLFGQLCDILVRPHTRFPLVTGIAVRPRGSKDVLYFPWTAVRTASAEGMRIASPPNAAAPYEPHPDEIHLRRDVLDQQIVDVSGKRVVRVHDLKLGAVAGRVLLTHADVGVRGILRRLGWEHFTLTLCRALHIHLPERLIAWEHLRMPSAGGSLEADATREALRRIHPEDLADVAEDLSASERAAFLQSMDEDVAADAMEAMEPVALVAAVSQLPDRQASDLIDEMEPDEGADLLGELPQERADALLNLMAPDQAADLRRLLSYPEDSAGGLMTPEHVTVRAGITAAEALAMVRERGRDVQNIYYVYVVDEEGRLKGTLSLRDLIMEDPGELVDSLMVHDVVSVTLDTKQTDIARLVARYNLLAAPVVDEEGHLQGIVTADDAIDAVVPTSWKKRIPKAFGR